VRLFVALELPAEVRKELGSWRSEALADIPGARLLALESMHVTLCFLGWQEDDGIEAIAAICETIAGEPQPELELGPPLWLSPRRPRVIAVELRDLGDRLAAAQLRLSNALHAGGWYTPEDRQFRAHVTVARFGKGARVKPHELPAPRAIRFQGSRVTLFRSRIGRAGASYEPLATVKLGSGPAQPCLASATMSRASAATSGDPSPVT
jgi:2'-5' RNA ligase